MRHVHLFAVCAVSAAFVAGAATAQTIAVGQTTTGELSTSDIRLDDGSYVDCYDLQTQAGQRLQIDQTAGLFDSFLSVMGGGCSNPMEVLAQDDDGGGGVHSRIVRQGDGTVWAVVVNSVEPDVTGGYQLRVTAVGSTAPAAASADPSALLPRVQSEWGVEPLVCHAAYSAMVGLRTKGIAPDARGNVRGINYGDRAARTRSGVDADDAPGIATYAQNFEMMAMVGEIGASPNGTPNGHRPLAEFLTVLGDCDRANRFTPVTAY